MFNTRPSASSSLALPLACLLLAASALAATPALAGSGIAISIENMFVPMGKQVEKVYDGSAQISASASPLPADSKTVTDSQGKTTAVPPAGSKIIVPGRQTTEWIGLSGFFDLNRNWRLLGGAHTTLLGGKPLFKLDASIAFLLPVPDIVPLQPYVFFGATPVISASDIVPPFGFNLHGGLGVDFVWNNTLFTSIKLNVYMLSIYGEKINNDLNLHWQPASFSLSAWKFSARISA